MKTFLIILASLVASAQTLPTLPAVNVVTAGDVSCTFETADATGGLISQCRQLSDGLVLQDAAFQATEEGAMPGAGRVSCLHWKTADGKYRLQCADQNKIVIDGTLPTTVTRKRRWYRLWM